MYPLNLFTLFPPFPRNNRVFVAMSFNEAFRKRWDDVIGPAVGSVRLNGIPLEPHRADMRKVSDSILTEILTEISECRLILADVLTTQAPRMSTLNRFNRRHRQRRRGSTSS